MCSSPARLDGWTSWRLNCLRLCNGSMDRSGLFLRGTSCVVAAMLEPTGGVTTSSLDWITVVARVAEMVSVAVSILKQLLTLTFNKAHREQERAKRSRSPTEAACPTK